ncbi:MAG: ABC transporter permease [Rhodospirillales bacterium]|jgi:NitT/TauT family transport system permease protein|nr:ABC transporter permease [Rhodospirillales bacterium]
MNTGIETLAPARTPAANGRRITARIKFLVKGRGVETAFFSGAGLAVLLGLWWIGGFLIATNPDTSSFAGFAPGPAFAALGDILVGGGVWEMIGPSLYRIGTGLFWAVLVGVPTGIVIGRYARLGRAAHTPFQFLRMISPLAWMPITILVFETWDGAIVFLISAAAVWPIVFATANGLRKIDPQWFKVARNLGGRELQVLRHVVLPAIAQDVLTGIRLALGISWVVLVPAEYLGVTSGLGYGINDARDTLEYDRLAAIVVLIGAIGFVLDGLCLAAIKHFNWQQAD